MYQGFFPSGYFTSNVNYSAPPELGKVPYIHANYNSNGEIIQSREPKFIPAFLTGSNPDSSSTNPSQLVNDNVLTTTVSCNQGPISHTLSSNFVYNNNNKVLTHSAISGSSSYVNLGNSQLPYNN